MISVEYDGCLYAFKRGISGGFWYGQQRLSKKKSGANYPGDYCKAPICMSTRLTMTAVSSGHSIGEFRQNITPKSLQKAKATRLPKKKTNSISIF